MYCYLHLQILLLYYFVGLYILYWTLINVYVAMAMTVLAVVIPPVMNFEGQLYTLVV